MATTPSLPGKPETRLFGPPVPTTRAKTAADAPVLAPTDLTAPDRKALKPDELSTTTTGVGAKTAHTDSWPHHPRPGGGGGGADAVSHAAGSGETPPSMTAIPFCSSAAEKIKMFIDRGVIAIRLPPWPGFRCLVCEAVDGLSAFGDSSAVLTHLRCSLKHARLIAGRGDSVVHPSECLGARRARLAACAPGTTARPKTLPVLGATASALGATASASGRHVSPAPGEAGAGMKRRGLDLPDAPPPKRTPHSAGRATAAAAASSKGAEPDVRSAPSPGRDVGRGGREESGRPPAPDTFRFAPPEPSKVGGAAASGGEARTARAHPRPVSLADADECDAPRSPSAVASHSGSASLPPHLPSPRRYVFHRYPAHEMTAMMKLVPPPERRLVDLKPLPTTPAEASFMAAHEAVKVDGREFLDAQRFLQGYAPVGMLTAFVLTNAHGHSLGAVFLAVLRHARAHRRGDCLSASTTCVITMPPHEYSHVSFEPPIPPFREPPDLDCPPEHAGEPAVFAPASTDASAAIPLAARPTAVSTSSAVSASPAVSAASPGASIAPSASGRVGAVGRDGGSAGASGGRFARAFSEDVEPSRARMPLAQASTVIGGLASALGLPDLSGSFHAAAVRELFEIVRGLMPDPAAAADKPADAHAGGGAGAGAGASANGEETDLPARYQRYLAVQFGRRRAQVMDERALTVAQRSALNGAVDDASTLSAAALPKLLETVRGLKGKFELNLGGSDVQEMLAFIRDRAPMIVHFCPKKIAAELAKDGVYRNQFETRTSGGSTSLAHRRAWEDDLFGRRYAAGADAERPKYGVLNLTLDPAGLATLCAQYGDSFLLLKPAVRYRATFTSRDSSYVSAEAKHTHQSAAERVATPESCAHVLSEFTQQELRALARVTTGRSLPIRSADVVMWYKEMQIHGPLSLTHDVESMYIHPANKSDPATLAALTNIEATFRVPLVWLRAD
jgi:Protein of unknown function (DUF3626)